MGALPLAQEALVARAPGCNVFLHPHCRMVFSSLLDGITTHHHHHPHPSDLSQVRARSAHIGFLPGFFLLHRNTVADKEETLF